MLILRSGVVKHRHHEGDAGKCTAINIAIHTFRTSTCISFGYWWFGADRAFVTPLHRHTADIATTLDVWSAEVGAKLSDPAVKTSLVFEAFDLPSSNQRLLGPPHQESTVTPLALRPVHERNIDIPLDSVVESIKSLQTRDSILTKLVAKHGTLLFRGLIIHDAEEFSRFAHAFGYKPHEIIGIVVDRPLLAPNVAPANEAPKEVLIYNHNESLQVLHAPGYIFFYSHKAPGKGGETPISSSLELFQRAKDETPDFIDELAQQHVGGSTLKQAFGKHVDDDDDEPTRRAKMEAQIARYGRGEHTTWEWGNDGSLVVTHKLPTIRTQPGTGLPTLFTGLAAYYKNKTVNSGSGNNVTQQLFGDGTPIPEKYLAYLAKITDEIRVLHKWQRGDVLVYDNVIAQHGRQPWEGEQSDRVVLASLFDGQVPGAYNDASWAQIVAAADD